jgi:hypothetical protein
MQAKLAQDTRTDPLLSSGEFTLNPDGTVTGSAVLVRDESAYHTMLTTKARAEALSGYLGDETLEQPAAEFRLVDRERRSVHALSCTTRSSPPRSASIGAAKTRALAAIVVALGACGVQPPEECLSCLSSQGLYADVATKQVVADALAYTPAYEAWSDGADKRRWLILPTGRKIDTSDLDHWKFPIGTKLFKEFSLNGVRLETRMIETVADTGDVESDHRFAAYVWREDATDADLAPTSGVNDVLGTNHDVPSGSDCVTCHQGEPGAALGFSAVQLSGSTAAPTLPEVAPLLSAPPAAVYPIPGDAIQSAALGFLHANCGHCHYEGNTWPWTPSFRMYTADATRNAAITVGLIHSRGPTTRGGYDGKDGSEAGPRDACAASVHGGVQGGRGALGAGRGQDDRGGRARPRPDAVRSQRLGPARACGS